MRQTAYIIGTSVLQKLRYEDSSFFAVDYGLHTTSFIYSPMTNIEVPHVSVITFSADEMEQFLSYFYANKILNVIGFRDSSAIYYAAKNHCPIIVNDKVTIRACVALGVEYVELTYLLTLKKRHVMTG